MPPAGNEHAPHAVVVGLEAQVFERQPDGQYAGAPVRTEARVLRLAGADRADALRRLAAFLDSLKDLSDP